MRYLLAFALQFLPGPKFMIVATQAQRAAKDGVRLVVLFWAWIDEQAQQVRGGGRIFVSMRVEFCFRRRPCQCQT